MDKKLVINYGEGDSAIVKGLKLSEYNDGNLAVLAVLDWGEENDEDTPISINLAHGQPVESKSLKGGEFFVKNYSEGQKLYNALLKAGWLQPTGLTSKSGFVDIPACRIGANAEIIS